MNVQSLNPFALHIEPIERAKTIPASWYTDPFFYDLDKNILFEESWQFVGHTSQLSSPGSFITATFGDESVLVVRGKDGEIRGFFNVCLHRGVQSRAYDQGRFSVQCEQGVYHFQKLLKESYTRLTQNNG
ncbi:MAG: Rieske 2Fe-2S domain-containing protein [Rhodothermaceae bacterium]|nr:Rieske 2Fe-2S domain-containing protein [Rhodothermaceae bacterium]